VAPGHDMRASAPAALPPGFLPPALRPAGRPGLGPPRGGTCSTPCSCACSAAACSAPSAFAFCSGWMRAWYISRFRAHHAWKLARAVITWRSQTVQAALRSCIQQAIPPFRSGRLRAWYSTSSATQLPTPAEKAWRARPRAQPRQQRRRAGAPPQVPTREPCRGAASCRAVTPARCRPTSRQSRAPPSSATVTALPCPGCW